MEIFVFILSFIINLLIIFIIDNYKIVKQKNNNKINLIKLLLFSILFQSISIYILNLTK